MKVLLVIIALGTIVSLGLICSALIGFSIAMDEWKHRYEK